MSPATSAASVPRPLKQPDHLSHSSRETLLRCAKSYFLKKIAGAPQRPALWLAGGSAVHECTEAWDLMSLMAQENAFSLRYVWDAHFYAHLSKARQAEPNENVWRKSKTEPIETWNKMGPEFVQSYIDWRKRSKWEVWTTPEGERAIELDVSGYLPGCPVEIKAYVDRIFWDPVFKKLWIADLKTGKKPPKGPDQFEVYAALCKVKYDVDIRDGAVFMNRRGELGKPLDLSEATPERIGALFGEAWKQIQSGNFEADTSDCFLCDVDAACHAKNGPLAHLYDPAHPNYSEPVPF